MSDKPRAAKPKGNVGDQIMAKGLPSNVDAERLILGSIILDDAVYATAIGQIAIEHFSLEKHRRIFREMSALSDNGERIDRVTIANSLQAKGLLESVDGLSYLASLDDGIPRLPKLDGYFRIVREKYRLRRALEAAERITAQVYSGDFSPDEISKNGQNMLSESLEGYGNTDIETVASFMANYPGGMGVLLDPTRRAQGIATGFDLLDEWTGGMYAKEIFLIGARPGQGKTAMLGNLAKSLAGRGYAGAVFSLEMSKEALVDRLICEEAYLSITRFRKGDLLEGERSRLLQAANKINDMPLHIDDNSGLRVADIRVKLTKLMREQPIAWYAIDYAQLLRGQEKRYSNENAEFTEIGNDLQNLTKTLGIPLILLSQLNRESEKATGDNKPRLAQCRGAGVWEQIANVGALIYREYAKKRDREDIRDKAELIVEKNRSGRTGTINLRYIDWLMRFQSETEPDEPPFETPAEGAAPSA